MQPFSITLFAHTGDPEGILHLDKSNWSAYCVLQQVTVTPTEA